MSLGKPTSLPTMDSAKYPGLRAPKWGYPAWEEGALASAAPDPAPHSRARYAEALVSAGAAPSMPEWHKCNPVPATLTSGPVPTEAVADVPGYESLRAVLEHAYNQAARGKGRDRHARIGEGFEQQPIFDMAKRFGVGSLLAQAYKKSDESQRLEHLAAQRELLGAIVYLAAACIHNDNNQSV